MSDETTEVVDTAQSTATGEGSSQGAPDVSGLQQRINELTAGMREAQRESAEARQATQQAMLQLAELKGAVSAGAPRQPAAPEVDYSVFGDAADPLKKVLDAQAAQFQRQLAQINSQVAAQLQASQIQTLAMQQQLPPAVVAEATRLMNVISAKYGPDANATDALDLAIGQAIRNGTYKPGGVAAAGGRAMGAPPAGATLHGGSPSVVPVPPANGQPKGLVLPTNFADMTPAQQQAYLQKSNQDIDFDL